MAAGISATENYRVVLLIVTSVLGSLVGDHILYAVGMRGGHRLLALYCRLSLGSVRCVERTVAYFRRFGAAAVLVCRFSTGVRLFAAILAGSGQIRYRRFIALDAIGTLVYATLWIVFGSMLGAAILERVSGFGRVLLLLGPAALIGVLSYRLIRRWWYGPAASDLLPPP